MISVIKYCGQKCTKTKRDIGTQFTPDKDGEKNYATYDNGKRKVGNKFAPDRDTVLMDNIEMKLLNRSRNETITMDISLQQPDALCNKTIPIVNEPEIRSPAVSQSLDQSIYILNGIEFDYFKYLESRCGVNNQPTCSNRGQISVRPETQVMSQTVHHKPVAPAPVTTSPPYIVLDDLVRKAVQKEWLELDYGAQWWSNDHAPTIYANSKLIPSLSSFLSNRWSELKPILQKRPVAAKKIRLKRSSEADGVAEAAMMMPAQQPAQVVLTSHPASSHSLPLKQAYSSDTLNQRHSTTLNVARACNQEIPDFYTLLPSPPDVKPTHLPQIHPPPRFHPQQNVPSSAPSSQTLCGLSMPRLTESPPVVDSLIFPPNRGVENTHVKSLKLASLLTSVNCSNFKSTPTFNGLDNSKDFQQNHKERKDCDILFSHLDDLSLKMKIKINTITNTHKNGGNDLHKEIKQGQTKKPKKVKSPQSANGPKKKKKRTIKIKYITPYKIRKCSVMLVRVSDEILRKYTGLTNNDLKSVFSSNNKSAIRFLESKAGQKGVSLVKVKRRPRGPLKRKATPAVLTLPSGNTVNMAASSIVPNHSTNSLTLSSLLSSNNNTISNISSVPSSVCSTPPLQQTSTVRTTSLNDVTITPVNKMNPSSNNTSPVKSDTTNTNVIEKSETRNSTPLITSPTRTDPVKSSNLSVAEKLELLKAESLSVTLSPPRDPSLSINNTVVNEEITVKGNDETASNVVSDETIPDRVSDEATTKVNAQTLNKDAADDDDDKSEPSESSVPLVESSDKIPIIESVKEEIKTIIKSETRSEIDINSGSETEILPKIEAETIIKMETTRPEAVEESNEQNINDGDKSKAVAFIKAQDNIVKEEIAKSLPNSDSSKDSDSAKASDNSKDSDSAKASDNSKDSDSAKNSDSNKDSDSSKDKIENCSRPNGTVVNDITKRERFLSPPPPKACKPNADYINGKIIPLGQKSHCHPVILKRRSSEDLMLLSNSVSPTAVDKTKLPSNGKESPKKDDLEKTTPLINSNKDNENNNNAPNNDVDSASHTIDMNMNYTNKLAQIPLKNNTPSSKNTKLKEINSTVKETVSADSSDSNKENTFIEQSFGNELEDSVTNKRTRLDEEPALKKVRLDPRTDESVTKPNLKIDLTRMKLEEEAAAATARQQSKPIEVVKRKIRPVERPMELPSTSFDDYCCARCEGIFMHYKEWKMHYDAGHPKCAKVAAAHNS